MGLLDDQIAIITGAGTGIGREAALMFANEGASLVLAGRRIEPLNEVVQLIESWPVRFDDTAARTDWDWSPQFGLERMADDFLGELLDVSADGTRIRSAG